MIQKIIHINVIKVLICFVSFVESMEFQNVLDLSQAVLNKIKCFGVEVADQNKTWVPQKVCNRCYTMLTRWQKNKQQQNLNLRNQ